MNYEKSLQDIIFNMLCDPRYVFYGLFLAELNKSFDDKFPTACVGNHVNSATINLTIGKDFWEKTLFNDSRKKAILIHELEHVIREHLSDMSQGMFPDNEIANIAMDVSINQSIIEELPRIDENGQKCGVYIEDFPEMKLKKHESSLYYYTEFMKGKEEKKKSKGQGKDSKAGKPGNGDGTSGCKTLDEMLDAREKGKDIGKGRSGDWHELWKELTEGMGDKENELLRKETQETLRRVAEETQKLRGNVPMHISNSIKEDFGNKPPVISWKTLFNRFIGSTLTTDIYQTRKRPNFRFEDAPTNRYKNKIKIVVGCDSSGSVSDHELREFFGQIKHMHRAGVKIDVCMWDTNVHLEYEYKGENKWERVCQGGTFASSFIEHVNNNKHKKNWTCAINLTDGYIEHEPIACKIPMLWVITSSGSTEFKHKGRKIKINS